MTTHTVTRKGKTIAGPMKYWEAVEYVKKNHLIKRLPSKGKFVFIRGVDIKLKTWEYDYVQHGNV